MRAVIQRCNYCRVFSDDQKVGEIGKGLVVLLGIKKGDTDKDIEYVASKLLNLRIFEDEFIAERCTRRIGNCITIYFIW